jgi:uncharacterized protein with HEPN domain
MQRDPKLYLNDIVAAANYILDFTANMTFEQYKVDVRTKSAVERQFGIIGDATSLLSRIFPEIAVQLSNYRNVISFRNVVIHGYRDIDDELVWQICKTRLPTLLAEVTVLLEELDAQAGS